MTEIQRNLNKVLEDIEAVSAKYSDNRKVKLCAVSKFHTASEVMECIDGGQILYGENRVQEAFSKFEEINSILQYKNKSDLHIIGSLQSNKVKKAVMCASCIQSVDRFDLMTEIEKNCAALGKNMDVFLEIHTAEDSKAGFSSEDDVYALLEKVEEGLFPHVFVKGLMTMAPFTDDEKAVRQSFVTLRNLRDSINTRFSSLDVKELSMGMSGDYKIAIQEGSTMVRIGTAIFGERDYSK